MSNVSFGSIESLLNDLDINLKEVERLYPKIHEAYIPLSATGVSARVYLHWKKLGLLPDSPEVISEIEQRSWVRLNLIEFVWLKIIQVMRDFGLPLEVIKEAKTVMFSDTLSFLIQEKEAFFNVLQSESNMSKKKIDSLRRLIDVLEKEIKDAPEEFGIHATVIGSLIVSLLLRNDQSSIIITKIQDKFDVLYTSQSMQQDFAALIETLLEEPHIAIPIKNILGDFFVEPKTEKFISTYNLLNFKEKKVIDAMRTKDFKEITIRFNSKNEELIIDIEKDGDFLDDKARQVKKILGLNEYSEVTVKYRNDKNLYFTTKTRLQ